jgi:hypothetical protein
MLMQIYMLDRWGQPVSAEIAVRRDTVEVRCQESLVGIADRDRLRAWLWRPEGVYAYDEIAWMEVGDRVSLAIDDVVPAWLLDAQVLAGLREEL